MRKTTAPKRATTPTIVVVVPLRICGSVGEKKTIDVEKWSVKKGGILQEKEKKSAAYLADASAAARRSVDNSGLVTLS